MAFDSLGKLLIYIGVIIVMIGAFFLLFAKMPWFGKLPGDIVYRREGLTVYIPIVTMVLISIFLTLFLNIIWRR